MKKDMGASADADRAVVNGAGQAVSALRASVPSAGADRELWRSGPSEYPDIVFVTADGALGLKADFGRPITMTIGEWHYLPTKIERLSSGYKSFPRDVANVLAELSDGDHCRPARDIADELRLTEARVQEIHRALKILGFAHCGTLMTDEGAVAGRGYWRSPAGDSFSYALSSAAQAIEARRAETGTGSVHESAVPAGDAPAPSRTPPQTPGDKP